MWAVILYYSLHLFFIKQGFFARHNSHRLARMLSKLVSVPSSSTTVIDMQHAQPFCGYWGSNTCPHASVKGTVPTGLSLQALSLPFVYLFVFANLRHL